MYVIAGASGHVGSVAASKLLDGGDKVRVFVRSADKGKAFAARGAEVAVGTLDDTAALATAFAGAKGAFVLLPPNMQAPDFRAYQRTVADAITAAVDKSKVPHVVVLSSIGADLESGTGPILGLHWLEESLKKTGVALSLLRPGYFIENVLNVVPVARAQGIYPNFGHPENANPMIATRDIGVQVARSLKEPPAKVKVTDITGPSYAPKDIAATLGKVLGKEINVVNIPEEGWIPGLMQGGFSQHLAELFVEMYRAFGSGKVRPVGDAHVTGTTTLEEVLRANV